MFYDAANFPFTSALEASAAQIAAEFRSIVPYLEDWVEKDLYGQGWKVFGLYGFPHGNAISANTCRCPLTSDLVHRLAPSHGAVGFSVLQPHTHIQPHQGYPGKFLRCHLGLIIPEGDCALRVQQETRRWQAGKACVFDDRDEHEAWNRTEHPRAVLLFDFVPDVSMARGPA